MCVGIRLRTIRELLISLRSSRWEELTHSDNSKATPLGIHEQAESVFEAEAESRVGCLFNAPVHARTEYGPVCL